MKYGKVIKGLNLRIQMLREICDLFDPLDEEGNPNSKLQRLISPSGSEAGNDRKLQRLADKSEDIHMLLVQINAMIDECLESQLFAENQQALIPIMAQRRILNAKKKCEPEKLKPEDLN